MLYKLGLLSLALSAGVPSAFSDTPADSPRLFGANLSGGEFHNSSIGYPGPLGSDYFYPSTASLDWAKSQGFNLIRVPFRWERVQWDLNGPLTSADIAALDTVLDKAEARGLRVVLDMHNYTGRRIGVANDKPNQTSYSFGAPELPASAYADVWAKLADHFKDRVCIWGYDIMNEPSGISHAIWIEYSQAAIDAIRTVDTAHAIILEGTYSAGASRWLDEGAYLLTSVTDPANNIIYSAHSYMDRDSSGTWSHGGTMQAELVGQPGSPDLAAAQERSVRQVKVFTDWCVANNVRGLLGEYGCPQAIDVQNWKIGLENMLNYIRDNTNGLVSATQWGGGGFGSSYNINMGSRKDNSEPIFMPMVRTYSNNLQTNYWFNFTVYANAITNTADYTYAYTFPTENCTVQVKDQVTFYGAPYYSGGVLQSASIHFNYTAPAGVYAGGGIHLRGPLTEGGLGGMDLSKNRDAGHMLSFYAKATPGATMTVTMATTSSDTTGVDTGAETHVGSAVSVGSISPLNDTWQRYEIPLSSIFNAGLTGNQRIQRIKFNFGPSDGNTYDINIDQITIGVPSTNTVPVVTIDTSTGASSFSVGQNIPFVATATDANAGDTIDYVEFNADGWVIGVDDTAPYEFTTSFATAGTYEVTAVAYDNHGTIGQSTVKTLNITAGPPTLTTVTSIATEDGWVAESSETSNVGGTLNATGNKLIVGDNSVNKQYKAFASFDTSALPDGATIVSATLKLMHGDVSGTNPFTTHGTCYADVVNGSFNDNAALETADFQAAATASQAATMSTTLANGQWSTGTLNAAGLAAINKTGRTQLRIYFATDDNNDAGNDYVRFYDADDFANKRPVLEITYYP